MFSIFYFVFIIYNPVNPLSRRWLEDFSVGCLLTCGLYSEVFKSDGISLVLFLLLMLLIAFNVIFKKSLPNAMS